MSDLATTLPQCVDTEEGAHCATPKLSPQRIAAEARYAQARESIVTGGDLFDGMRAAKAMDSLRYHTLYDSLSNSQSDEDVCNAFDELARFFRDVATRGAYAPQDVNAIRDAVSDVQ